MENLNNKSVNDLKILLKQFDLVNGISSLKKDDLIKTLRAVQKYKNNKQVDYHEFYFGDKLVKLSNEQHEVVTTDIKYNMRIIAAAGSGKTTTIVCRIKYLIDHGIDAERILLVCFNVDAAESMKNKLVELFGFIPKISVGTLDSLACRYYHRYFKQDHFVNISEYATYFLKFLQTDGNPVVSLYHYVFFDEQQDCNSLQFEIIRCFYNHGAKISVIGDPNQCVYAFRGADIRYIINLEQYFVNLKTYNLSINHRSTPEIINLANASIKFNKEQIFKDMVATKPTINFLPVVKYFDSLQDQNKEIIQAIINFNKQGIPNDEIAILSRNNFALKILEEAIERYNTNVEEKIKYVSLINDDRNDAKPKMRPLHLTLTTIHKSKGLEFAVVYIIGCNDELFPSETDKLSLNEERRLFFVATTRAKQYLFYFFHGSKNKIAKVSRFIQELDRKYYHFANYDKKYYFYDDYRSVKWFNGVTETIALLNEKDIALLRENGILPKENPTIKKIHGKHEFNNYVTSYYLQADYGEFIDRYITRHIGKRNNESNGLVDISTIIIISAYQFTNEELIVFKKYEANFKFNMNKINVKTPEWKYLPILNQNERKLTSFRIIDNNEIQIISSIIKKLLITSNKYNIDINILINCFSIKNEIPEQFKKKIIESYNRYNNDNYLTNELLYDVYNISLCNTILNDRRRLIYKNVYDYFVDQPLLTDIDLYVDTLEPEFSKLLCKKFVISNEYDLIGEIDLINLTHNKLIDFKCSSSDQFKLPWLLQLLAYLSILRKSYPQITINELEVYNPLQGEIYTFDMSKWNKADEYLSYLYEIRVRQMTRNLDIVDKDIENNYPIKYDNFDKKDDKMDDKMDEENDILIEPEEKQFNLKHIFGDNYKFFLDSFNKNKQLTNNHSDMMELFNHHSNHRYMVVDTETTGLPERPTFGGYYPYTEIDKYNGARMIQICWAIYDDGKLVEIQDYLIRPNGFVINNSHIHGITNQMARGGHKLTDVLVKFSQALNNVKYIVGHNIKFDVHIICSELYRNKFHNTIAFINQKELICTMEKSIPLKVDGCLKAPKLIKLYKFLFGKEFEHQHNAKYDVLATGEVFIELTKRKLICL
ncbi:UvrD/REP helicase family protein [Klosneuvirus KNV1]|uniref:DNA 3'-5' helicase n=1 Tax=Klosneuvirus KNV1 TaxID=1977640 RepID=A0A1V0SIN4_9VIRU|nr:UvrD/REP helicase family protein [Klosneuvirus KNV1]